MQDWPLVFLVSTEGDEQGRSEMTMPAKFVVYTAVFGAYDRVSEVDSSWDCDFVCFTDNPDLLPSGWRVVLVDLDGDSPAQINRRYKMLPHIYFPNYECSLYVDGNIKIVKNPCDLFAKYLDDGVIAIPKHQDRDCAYEEASICIKSGIVSGQVTARQMGRYAAEGFPKNYGLTENGVIFRRHHDEKVVPVMNRWWDEYRLGGKRDQLSLPYLFWRDGLQVQDVVEGPRISSEYFVIELHAGEMSMPLISRLARIANGRRHLTLFYFISAKLVSIALIIRQSVFRALAESRDK